MVVLKNLPCISSSGSFIISGRGRATYLPQRSALPRRSARWALRSARPPIAADGSAPLTDGASLDPPLAGARPAALRCRLVGAQPRGAASLAAHPVGRHPEPAPDSRGAGCLPDGAQLHHPYLLRPAGVRVHPPPDLEMAGGHGVVRGVCHCQQRGLCPAVRNLGEVSLLLALGSERRRDLPGGHLLLGDVLAGPHCPGFLESALQSRGAGGWSCASLADTRGRNPVADDRPRLRGGAPVLEEGAVCGRDGDPAAGAGAHRITIRPVRARLGARRGSALRAAASHTT